MGIDQKTIAFAPMGPHKKICAAPNIKILKNAAVHLGIKIEKIEIRKPRKIISSTIPAVKAVRIASKNSKNVFG